jgi:hypothetical protein
MSYVSITRLCLYWFPHGVWYPGGHTVFPRSLLLFEHMFPVISSVAFAWSFDITGSRSNGVGRKSVFVFSSHDYICTSFSFLSFVTSSSESYSSLRRCTDTKNRHPGASQRPMNHAWPEIFEIPGFMWNFLRQRTIWRWSVCSQCQQHIK